MVSEKYVDSYHHNLSKSTSNRNKATEVLMSKIKRMELEDDLDAATNGPNTLVSSPRKPVGS